MSFCPFVVSSPKLHMWIILLVWPKDGVTTAPSRFGMTWWLVCGNLVFDKLFRKLFENKARQVKQILALINFSNGFCRETSYYHVSRQTLGEHNSATYAATCLDWEVLSKSADSAICWVKNSIDSKVNSKVSGSFDIV